MIFKYQINKIHILKKKICLLSYNFFTQISNTKIVCSMYPANKSTQPFSTSERCVAFVHGYIPCPKIKKIPLSLAYIHVFYIHVHMHYTVRQTLDISSHENVQILAQKNFLICN